MLLYFNKKQWSNLNALIATLSCTAEFPTSKVILRQGEEKQITRSAVGYIMCVFKIF